MTDDVMELLLPKLERRLGLTEPEEDTVLLLVDELMDAEGELLLYLGISELEEAMLVELVELAGIFYRRDCAEHPELKSESYTEGQLSESRSYLTGEEYRGARNEVLERLGRYRRVACK